MIARDEEAYIANAIGSVKDIVDEIIVVDTGSVDRTPVIARELGAKIIHFDWNDDFAEARNFGLKNVSSDWVFFLDADEEVLKEQAQGLRKLADSDMDAFLFIQKNFSNNSGFGFIPESRRGFKGYFPSFIVRMFRADRGIRFEGFVHETIDASLAGIKARIGFTDIGIYHFQELKGGDEFRKKQVKYADMLEKNIDQYPNKAKAYHDIGLVYYRFKDDYEKAIVFFKKSISIEPKNVNVLNDLAAAYAHIGRNKEAIEFFGKSLEVRPEPSTFFNIGLLQEKLGNFEAAILSYKEAVRLNHPRKSLLLEKIGILEHGKEK
ncbi:glycosyltransferase [Candidatus Woesearchaeota archaeon]|nr:glycosyltransferase [Candidatus Woesearchaeota archaeon]